MTNMGLLTSAFRHPRFVIHHWASPSIRHSSFVIRHSPWAFWLPAAFALAADLATKHLAFTRLVRGEKYPILGPWLGWWPTAPNPGGVFGLFPGHGYVFVGLTVVALGVVGWMVWAAKPERLLFRLALGLITGGALGNLVDRLTMPGVRDFIKLRYWPFAFNVADTFICIAAGLLILEMVREGKRAEAQAK